MFKMTITDISFYNVILLSISFLFIYTAIGTNNYIVKVMVNSVNKQQPSINWNSFISSSLMFSVFSFANFLVPSIIAWIGCRKSLFFSSLLNLVCLLVFFYPFRYGLEISSLFMGFAAAVLWGAQGTCLIENSPKSEKNIDRNIATFWCTYEFGLVLGSLYFFIKFQGIEEVKEYDRLLTYGVLLSINLIGCILLLFIKKKQSQIIQLNDEISIKDEDKTNPLIALKKCLALFKTKKMILISIASFYTGCVQSFFYSVYPTAVAYTKHFGADSVKLIGIYGIANGLGECIGAIVFSWLLRKFARNNRSKVYFFAFIIHLISFLLIYINHPMRSSIEETYEPAFIEPRIWIAILCGFFLGLGDAIQSTQIIALIGTIYSDNQIETSSAFSLYKFTHSISASITFFYAAFDLTLDIHLAVLVIFAFFSVFTFYLVDKIVKKNYVEM